MARRGGRTGGQHGNTLPGLCLLVPVCGCRWVGGGCPPLLLWGGGGMLSGSGAACPFVSCFCFPLLCCCLFGGGVGGCGGVGGLVVNCIVDASIFVLCGVFLLCASRPGPAALFVVWWVLGVVLPVLCVVFMGVRWMPWHQGPMKDVVDCDKPRGAVWRALIRGFPNGGTRRPSWGVTRV